MIKSEYSLRQYDWAVTFYFNVTAHDSHAVMHHLWSIGCRGEDFRTAWNNVSKGCYNRGLTYSDYDDKRSIVIVGESSTFGELMNSLSHEIHHLSVHIAQANLLDLAGEEVCYIDGEVTQMVFEDITYEMLCSMQSTSSASCPLSSGPCKYDRVNKECNRSFHL